jgi:putative ABC transport system permease protein
MISRALLLEAVAELSRRKLRTLLTLLGMIFGVGAIVAMLAVGEGSKREALALVAQLGLNNVIVEAKEFPDERAKEIRARSLGLSAADASAAMQIVPGARSVALSKAIKTYALRSAMNASSAQALAVSVDYLDHAGLQIAAGRWFNMQDETTLSPVCVVGARLAQQLFAGRNPLGERVKVNQAWFVVIGVLAARDLQKQDFEGVPLGVDDERLFLSWQTARTRLAFSELEDEVDRVSVRLQDGASPAAAARALQALMKTRHGGADDTVLIVPAGLYKQNQQTQRIFSLVMGSIAAVSLLVGGIGIMNIMLANVLERRREIGLKRALGARKKNVVEQFLAEAVVISVSGALLGLMFGALLAYCIAWLAGWQVAWSPIVLLFAVLVCVAVGVGFGVYPARRAAELDPIASLRSDAG